MKKNEGKRNFLNSGILSQMINTIKEILKRKRIIISYHSFPKDPWGNKPLASYQTYQKLHQDAQMISTDRYRKRQSMQSIPSETG